MDKAKLIVLEGLDGSGKSTQFELLKDYLSDNNINYKAISFPEYDKPSSALVKMYLSGEFSNNASDVNAFAASSFYAVDRYASFKLFWEKDFNSGTNILAARYVSSNAIYQMTKLDENEWDSYIDWLCDYEYNKLGLPKPDVVVFLDMPIDISQKLMSKRYDGDESKKDIHEANVEFLIKCRKAALFAASRLGWKTIVCGENGEPFSVEHINDSLKKMISDLFKG